MSHSQFRADANRRWPSLVCACVLVLLVLSGCGGGGGEPGYSPVYSPHSSVSVSTSHVSLTRSTDASGASWSTNLILSDPLLNGAYVGYAYSNSAISAVQIEGVSEIAATVTINFKAPAQLGPGTYTDIIEIDVCYDSLCSFQLTNSPLYITTEFIVTLPPEPFTGPVLWSFSPPQATAGGLPFTLTVTGQNFMPGAVLQWNGVPKPTTYVSPTVISAQISAGDIAIAGTVAVTASNPAGGMNTSPARDFVVVPIGSLSLGAIAPTTVSAGGPDFTITVTGSGFTSSSIVQWNGAARPTTYASPIELTARIVAADIAVAGNAAISVFNPGLQGGVSSAIQLQIAAPSIDAVAFQINPAHTGAINFRNVSLPASSKWSVDVGGQPSYALIAQGKVFVTVRLFRDAKLVALDQATGAVVWGPMDIAGFANAAYDGGVLFVIADTYPGSTLQAIDAATGALKWTVPIGANFASPPTAAQGVVIASSTVGYGTLHAFNQADGILAWTQAVNGLGMSAPAISADAVYIAIECRISAFRPTTGKPIWSSGTGCTGGGGATPVVANGVLYTSDLLSTGFSGIMYNAATGAFLGIDMGDHTPAIGAQTGYFLQNHTLRGVSLNSNTVLWTFAGDGQLSTSPIVVNQFVFVGSASGNLYALNAATWEQVWQQNMGAPIDANMSSIPYSGLSAGDGILVVPAGNSVTAYTLSDNP